jgi:hypothetical protein
LARKAEPERRWQSAQWQMLMAAESISASNAIWPQWQCPSIFMKSFLSLFDRYAWPGAIESVAFIIGLGPVWQSAPKPDRRWPESRRVR